MKRLIVATALLLTTIQTGQASLETDCYFDGGYFGSTYFGADYFDETCSAGGGSAVKPPKVSMGFLRLGM